MIKACFKTSAWWQLPYAVGFLGLLAACAGNSTQQSPLLQPTQSAVLAAEIAETSGLACLASGHFLTINDSGHLPTVFEINHTGQILNRFEMSAQNRDWEAMTIHQGQLWVGDIGNNAGSRNGGELYRSDLPLKAGRSLHTRQQQFSYPDFPKAPLTIYQHDFDAEALASANGRLLLFNKAWQTEMTTVYQLPEDPSEKSARVVTTIAGLPGVVTDAAFSDKYQRFVLTGYARFRDNALYLALYNDYRPFLAVLDSHFKLEQIIPIEQGGQLEAICIDPQHDVWLTQEQSKRRPALLWRWGNMQQLLPTTAIAEKNSQIN